MWNTVPHGKSPLDKCKGEFPEETSWWAEFLEVVFFVHMRRKQKCSILRAPGKTRQHRVWIRTEKGKAQRAHTTLSLPASARWGPVPTARCSARPPLVDPCAGFSSRSYGGRQFMPHDSKHKFHVRWQWAFQILLEIVFCSRLVKVEELELDERKKIKEMIKMI